MTPVVRILLFANIAVFVLQYVNPSIIQYFWFVPRQFFLKPWTVLTYMFLHAPGSISHIFFNMLALFFFGPAVESRLGSRRFSILYFVSGITGAILSMIFAPYAPIIGASAGVFGVSLAFAYYWPDSVILLWGILPVKAKVLVVFTTAFSIFSGISGAVPTIAHFAHLGGYAGAYVYLKLLERRRGAFKRRAAAAPAEVVDRLKGWNTIDLATVHEANRPEVSRLLDKIRHQGVASLSGQERMFLSSFISTDRR